MIGNIENFIRIMKERGDIFVGPLIEIDENYPKETTGTYSVMVLLEGDLDKEKGYGESDHLSSFIVFLSS